MKPQVNIMDSYLQTECERTGGCELWEQAFSSGSTFALAQGSGPSAMGTLLDLCKDLLPAAEISVEIVVVSDAPADTWRSYLCSQLPGEVIKAVRVTSALTYHQDASRPASQGLLVVYIDPYIITGFHGWSEWVGRLICEAPTPPIVLCPRHVAHEDSRRTLSLVTQCDTILIQQPPGELVRWREWTSEEFAEHLRSEVRRRCREEIVEAYERSLPIERSVDLAMRRFPDLGQMSYEQRAAASDHVVALVLAAEGRRAQHQQMHDQIRQAWCSAPGRGDAVRDGGATNSYAEELPDVEAPPARRSSGGTHG